MLMSLRIFISKYHYLNTFPVYSFTYWNTKRGLKYVSYSNWGKISVKTLYTDYTFSLVVFLMTALFTAYSRLVKNINVFHIIYIYYIFVAKNAILYRCFISVKMFCRSSIGYGKYMFLMYSSPPKCDFFLISFNELLSRNDTQRCYIKHFNDQMFQKRILLEQSLQNKIIRTE